MTSGVILIISECVPPEDIKTHAVFPLLEQSAQSGQNTQ